MRVLAIDTATAASAVAVVEYPADGPPLALARRERVDPRGHAEWLTPLIRQTLDEAGLEPADLAAVVAGVGPGPFTGLRVGLATAGAMAQTLGIPTYGVCSLDGIGAVTGPGPALAATDARRREIYWAVYREGRRLTGPAVDRPDQLGMRLVEYGVRVACGEGARRYRDVLGLPMVDGPAYPDPVVLATVAAPRVTSGAPGEVLTPLYLRRPDAAEPRPPKPVTPR